MFPPDSNAIKVPTLVILKDCTTQGSTRTRWVVGTDVVQGAPRGGSSTAPRRRMPQIEACVTNYSRRIPRDEIGIRVSRKVFIQQNTIS